MHWISQLGWLYTLSVFTLTAGLQSFLLCHPEPDGNFSAISWDKKNYACVNSNIFRKSAHKAPSSFTSKTNCIKFVYGVLCKMKYDKLLNFLPSGRQNIQRTTMHCLYMQKAWRVHCKWGDSWSCLICSCRQVAAFVSWILLVKGKMQNFILVP